MITAKENIINTNKYLGMCFLLGLMLVQSCRLTSGASPTPELPGPTQEPPLAQPSPTLTIQPPTETPVVEPPVGFIEYQDSEVGVSIYIPGSWTVTGVIEGQYAIFSSYPEDKYVGGGKRELGDTKCDLNIRPQWKSADDLIQQWKSNDMTTILSEQEIILSSGQPGFQFELNNMGRANSLITEINGRVVVLTCFGDFTLFDEIAVTLKTDE